jgi:secreted trypsin-like serine protease
MRALLTCAVLLVLAAPAQAVVGGSPQDPAEVPWYADVGICGGTLIAPDRVMTAEHCVRNRSLDQLGVSVAGTMRAARGVTYAPGWQHRNGSSNVYDDVAIVTLDRPVEGVTPVQLGGVPTDRATILGKGLTRAGGLPDLVLRKAELRTMTDKECKQTWGKARGNDGERFRGSTMLCAIDADGKAPLSSGCNGDSGGPLYTGTPDAPRILGVVSYGGLRCGADHLPSVFAEVDHYRSFLLQPSLTLAPVAKGPSEISGKARVGRRLRCRAPGFTGGVKKRTIRWTVLDSSGTPKALGTGKTYKVGKRARGKRVSCLVEGSNAGGPGLAPPDSVVVPR